MPQFQTTTPNPRVNHWKLIAIVVLTISYSYSTYITIRICIEKKFVWYMCHMLVIESICISWPGNFFHGCSTKGTGNGSISGIEAMMYYLHRFRLLKSHIFHTTTNCTCHVCSMFAIPRQKTDLDSTDVSCSLQFSKSTPFLDLNLRSV